MPFSNSRAPKRTFPLRSFPLFILTALIPVAALADPPAGAAAGSPASVTAPSPDPEPVAARAILVTKRELTAQLQIFLDQQLFSPGMIDGQPGGFLKKALKRWQRAHALPETGEVDSNVPLDSVSDRKSVV